VTDRSLVGAGLWTDTRAMEEGYSLARLLAELRDAATTEPKGI